MFSQNPEKKAAKEADRQRRAEERQRVAEEHERQRAAERQRKAELKRLEGLSQVELAKEVKEQGERILQVHLTERTSYAEVGGLKVSNGAAQGQILAEIEALGWKLENVSTAYGYNYANEDKPTRTVLVQTCVFRLTT